MTQRVLDNGPEPAYATEKLMRAYSALVTVLLRDLHVDPQRLIRKIEIWYDDGVERICCSCGARAAGEHPAGWRIEPVYGPVGGQQTIVGERPICSGCLVETMTSSPQSKSSPPPLPEPVDTRRPWTTCTYCNGTGGPLDSRCRACDGHGVRPTPDRCAATTMELDQDGLRIAPPYEAEVTILVTPLHQLMLTGNALAKIVDELHNWSDTESVQAKALQEWEHALAVVGKAVQ